MLDTDIHTAQTARGTRPSALGDLRFAGTVATGLVAGTLGLGALAAPLVGWRDWPAGLTTSGSAGTAQLANPTPIKSQGTKPGGRSGVGGRPTPGGATALTGIGIPGATGGSPLGTGGISLTNSITATPHPERSSSTTTGSTQSESASGTFLPAGFEKPDNADTDLDGVPDVYENARGWDKNTTDGAADNGGGISRSTEFQIRSEIANPDTNGNGVIDRDDDSDGDGIPNGVEETNGTSAWATDSDGDGIQDGQEDNDGNGVPDQVDAQPPATPVVETPPEPVVPTTPPTDETPAPEAPAPTPEPEAPATPPVAETPAPAPPAEEAPAPPPAEQPPAESAPADTPAPEAPATPAPEPEAPAPQSEAPATDSAPAPAAPAPAPEAPAPAPAAPAPAPEAPAPAPAAPAPAPAAPAPAPDAPAPAAAAAAAPAQAADPNATPAW
jgi:hypothetical protein